MQVGRKAAKGSMKKNISAEFQEEVPREQPGPGVHVQLGLGKAAQEKSTCLASPITCQ